MKQLTLLIMLLLSFSLFAKEKEFNTQFLRIIYDEKYQEQALQMRGILEEITQKEMEFYNYSLKPGEKFTVVLRDTMDQENSYTLDNTILLYPNAISTYTFEKTYDDWYRYVFSHELTHAILNRKVGGKFKKIPLFGRTFHQMFLTSWYHEGLAVYSEVHFSENTIAGRELSKKFEMAIRTDVLEGKFKGLKFANGYYPNNDNYTHGYSFMKFFAETYGVEALRTAVNEVSEHQIRQPFNSFVKVAKLKNEKELYEKWMKYLDNKYKPKENIVEGNKMKEIKFGNKSNLVVHNGNLFYSDYCIDDTKDFKYGIYKYDISKNKEKQIKMDLPVHGFTFTDDALYYSSIRTNPKNNTNYAQSYKLRRKKEKYKKPENLGFDRAINFVYLDTELAYVYRENGKMGLKTTSGVVLISPDSGYFFQKFYYDKSNHKLYFAATKSDEKISYIYIFNLENNDIKKIVKGYSPFVVGDDLYFDDSLNGTFDVFKYNFKTEEITQITNVKYGAFEPVIVGKNLYFLDYENDGYNINSLEQNKFYNKTISETQFDEKDNSVDNTKDMGIIQKDLSIKDFKNSFKYRGGFIIPGAVAFSFTDIFWEKSIIVGLADSLPGSGNFKDRNSGVYYSTDESQTKSGAFANYEDKNWNIYGEGTSNSYGKISYKYPILGRERNSIFYGEIEADTDSEKSLNLYVQRNGIISKVGIKRTHDDEDSDLNEAYVDTGIVQLHYFWSDDTRKMDDYLDENPFQNMGNNKYSDSDDNQEILYLRYNIKAKNLILAKTELQKSFKANLGNVSGTWSIQNYLLDLNMYYLAWSESEQRLVYDASIGIKTFYFTNFPLTIKTGIIDQYDVRRNNRENDSSMTYIKYIATF